jgi:glycosyltransferase involved in cell wall biosynthesis
VTKTYSYNDKSVHFVTEQESSGQWFYRGFWPAECLKQYGFSTSVSNALGYPSTKKEWERDPRFFAVTKDRRHLEPTRFISTRLHHDLEIGGRMPMDDMPDAIARARAAGQVVIYDLDDNYWDYPVWHPLEKAHDDPKALLPDWDGVMAICESVSALFTSTQALADWMRERVKTPIYVIRNGINVTMFKETFQEHQPLRVGWAANLDFHGAAFEAHVDALRTACEGRDVEFWHLGGGDGRATKLLDPFPVPVQETPWVPYEQLGLSLAKIDIGLIMRLPSTFNEGQSTTSGLAWAAAGKPFLATTSAEYRRLEEVAGVGYLAEDPDDFARGLAKLIDRPDLRANDWRERVHRFHGPKPTAAQYSNAFAELLSGVRF